MDKYIAYYRVSTKRQERSGLGLQAQKDAVQTYMQHSDGVVLAEYQEAETGTAKRHRPVLAEAIAHCKNQGATLIIAKLDRLSRSVALVAALMESGVQFVACDNPHATPLTVHVLTAAAEDEARRISTRAKETAQVRKARGDHMGLTKKAIDKIRKTNGTTCFRRWGAEGGQASAEVRAKKAEEFKRAVRPLVMELHREGMSLRQIATRLNEEGQWLSPRGGKWHAGSVHRIIHEV